MQKKEVDKNGTDDRDIQGLYHNAHILLGSIGQLRQSPGIKKKGVEKKMTYLKEGKYHKWSKERVNMFKRKAELIKAKKFDFEEDEEEE